jgi:glycerol kinase
MPDHVLAIDQGTTSTRAILFDPAMRVAAVAQEAFAQHFPSPGRVEHDPEDLWVTTVATCRAAMERAGRRAGDIAAIGVATQRETTLVWERATGRAVHNAIVWQDRRTAPECARLREAGHEAWIHERTGLLLDPYFSATKLRWLLDELPDLRRRAQAGELAFGTVDTWLLWRLTGGAVHATDATNASRTLLYDLDAGDWSDALCDLFTVPRGMLPTIRDSAADYGTTRPDLFGGAIPIRGVAGDQQAAVVGQACFEPGMVKSTYGTGCFALLHTGTRPVRSSNRLLTTVAYQLDGQRSFALEGAVFVAGAVVQWLRDGLRLIREAAESETLARRADPEQAVYLVPAFTGLGAPYWDPECRGSIHGLTRNTGPAELARAALESVGYQTRDLLEAMDRDRGGPGDTMLRVDGGMVVNDWTVQFLADILGAPVDRPQHAETTALGAAWLAGMQAGIYPSMTQFAAEWALERRFEPSMESAAREARYAGWRDAVQRTLRREPGAG